MLSSKNIYVGEKLIIRAPLILHYDSETRREREGDVNVTEVEL